MRGRGSVSDLAHQGTADNTIVNNVRTDHGYPGERLERL